MSTRSIIRAVQLKVATLAAGCFPNNTVPPLYFDEAPQTDAAGAQVQPTTAGYGVVKHNGSRTRAYAFGGHTREDHEVVIEFYYPALADCRQAVDAVRLNGCKPSEKQGLDFGTLPDLAPPYKLLAIRPLGDEAGREPGAGKTGARVHSWLVRYRVELVRSAN